MPGTCFLCGEQVVEQTNSDGSYKGACVECKENYDRPPRHVEQCDKEDCLVCANYYGESG